MSYTFQSADKICAVCQRTPWHHLQPEDNFAWPHHTSRTALEQSAESCKLCKLVLKAAISHYKNSKGRRNGKGYWRTFEQVTYIETDGSERKVMFTSELGSCCPSGNSTFPRGEGGGQAVVAPTGKIDQNREHIDDIGPRLEDLELESPTQSMPVWLYSNCWANRKPMSQADTSWLQLMGIGARFASSAKLFDAANSRQDSAVICGSEIGICAEDDAVFDYIPGRLREIDSGSDVAIRRLRKWIDHCMELHPSCQPPMVNSPLPTRVIDVMESGRRVSIKDTAGLHGQYIALSHCWGKSSRIMLTTKTQEDLREGIAISFLPKTFRDAITLTKRLLVRYLWIDCLCIVQDDSADWEREAAKMGQVYRNAYLTISAANSTDSDTGCTPYRDSNSYVSPGTVSLGYNEPRQIQGGLSHTLNYSIGEGSNKRQTSLHLFEEWLPGSLWHKPQRVNIGSFGRSFDPIGKAPLSSRGWTVQERILSPRIVHYAEDQMYYECESGLLSEDGFIFPESPYSFHELIATQMIQLSEHGIWGGGMSLIPGQHASDTGIRWKGGWIGLVEDYCRRRLTVSEDKLPALAGLARSIAQATGEKYFAGVWGTHLYEDLFWRAYAHEETRLGHKLADGLQRPVKGKQLGMMSRPVKYRAPSWSWASIDGPIKFIPLSYKNLVAKVRDCYIKPVGTDLYSRVSAGSLDIEAPTFEVFPYFPKKPFNQYGEPIYIDLGDDRGKCIGSAFLDMPNEELKFPCYAMFLDPAYAILVRSNREISKVIKQHISPTELRNIINDGHILDTPGIKASIAKDPSAKGGSYKCYFDVERVGVAVFVRNLTELGEDGFPVDIEDKKPEPLAEGARIDPKFIVYGNDSWGPVKPEDPKVWLTVV